MVKEVKVEGKKESAISVGKKVITRETVRSPRVMEKAKAGREVRAKGPRVTARPRGQAKAGTRGKAKVGAQTTVKVVTKAFATTAAKSDTRKTNAL